MVSLKNGYYRVFTPCKFKNFNLQRGFFVFKIHGKLYMSSGWTCSNNLFCYTEIDNKYVGEWINWDIDPIVESIINMSYEA